MCNGGCKKNEQKEKKLPDSAKKSLQHETPHLSTGKCDVQINPNDIGTETVDFWLWIMDQDLRVAFGQ